MPVHIFIETHFPKSFDSDREAPQMSIADFENLPKHTIEFHKLGLKYFYPNNQIGSVVSSSRNPLLIELTSNQKLELTSSLVDESNGSRELEKATLVQTDMSNNNKYCLVAYLPDKRKTYQLNLYARPIDIKATNRTTTTTQSEGTYAQVAEYQVVRDGDQAEESIPKYNLKFDLDIALKSHQSQVITFDTNPLVMEFFVPETTLTLFELVGSDGKNVENSVLCQRSIVSTSNSSNLMVSVAVNKKNQAFFLELFARRSTSSWTQESGAYKFVSRFRLLRNGSNNNNNNNKNDQMRFVQLYGAAIGQLSSFYVYSPLEFDLKSNVAYEFKYFVKNAQQVSLVDNQKKMYNLENSSREPNIWILTKKTITTRGKLNLFVRFAQASSNSGNLTGLCFYQVS